MKRLWNHNGQNLEVSLEPHQNSYQLKIGDRKYIVHIAEIFPHLYSVSIDGKVHEIKSERIKSDASHKASFRLLFRNQDIKLDLINATKQPLAVASTGSSGSELVYPPMSGRVVKIMVRTNDSVKAGDTLLVLEAMKMQNEIKANIDGKIKSIAVKEAMVVDTSNLLIEIIPHPNNE